jgi:DNA polymerase III epsilon subunit-like protein
MTQKKLAFIDLETTGTNPFIHEIIEIGCVIAEMTDDGTYRMKEEWEAKVKPSHIETADPAALRVNGYDEVQWMFAHSLSEALTELSRRADGAVMVAHNVAFDAAFLAVAFGKTKISDPFFYAKLDTISLAYMRYRKSPDVSRFTLRALCEKFGIRNDRAHTALADARATFEVYQALMKS